MAIEAVRTAAPRGWTRWLHGHPTHQAGQGQRRAEQAARHIPPAALAQAAHERVLAGVRCGAEGGATGGKHGVPAGRQRDADGAGNGADARRGGQRTKVMVPG
eukprot:443686-Prymnesium_polylepis.1